MPTRSVRRVLLLGALLGCSETPSGGPPIGGAGTTGGDAGASLAGSGANAGGGFASGSGGVSGTAGQAGVGGDAGVGGGALAGNGGQGAIGATAGADNGSAGSGGNAGLSGAGVAGDAGASAAGGGAGGMAGAGASAGAGGAPCPEPATLKAAGDCAGRRVGVALTTRHLSEPTYRQAALEFNSVTPEDEMKWDATEPTRGSFTFGEADQIVDFAAANGMTVKGHTLVWHSQLPSWVTSITSATDLRAAMLAHIEGVMGHYKGKVAAWDVVNEAFDDDGNLRDAVWGNLMGPSYIEEAFRAARAEDPDAKLFYNDYDIENDAPHAEAAYQMVRDLVMREVPIDGVGMQMHTRTTNEDPPLSEFLMNLERYLALGLEVVVSEMDVRVCDGGTLDEQRQRYHDLIEVCLAEPRCTAVTFWGISDKDSWLNARTNLTCVGSEPPRGLLWDDNYVKKPAYAGVVDAFMGR